MTVEQLLSHRSGIGDYLDESAGAAITDYAMPVPVQQLATSADYLRVLDGHPTKFEPGERFEYCNSGFVLLAVLAERAAGAPFHELVQRLVDEPAGLDRTEFLRSDELPGDAALGYLFAEGLRTNVLHLPVRGHGDGGIFTTAADVRSLWDAVFAGRIVSAATVEEMVRPRGDASGKERRYGLGFWLHPSSDAVMLEGYDAGASFRSVHQPSRGITHSVLSNTSEGAWLLTRHLDEALGT